MRPVPETESAGAPSQCETLHIRSVSKSFDAAEVLHGIDLVVEPGEFLTLLGPSGCGKTTLLRIIAGFERPTRGSVMLGRRDVSSTPPERRPFNLVFQSYALFPHMSVGENVAYGLRASGVVRGEVRQRVFDALSLVDLTAAMDRSVVDLSGGQQQRVALARALVNEPSVLLLDEPLGALDLQLRRRLQEELRAIHSRLHTTFIYVTHDQEEALGLSDRIALMANGKIVQLGSPEEIYTAPATRFAAEFIGEANLLPCEVVEVSSDAAVCTLAAGGTTELRCAAVETLSPGAPALAVLRPEHLELVPPESGLLRGQIVSRRFLGDHVRHVVSLPTRQTVRVATPAFRSTSADAGEVGLQVVRKHGAVVADDREGSARDEDADFTGKSGLRQDA